MSPSFRHYFPEMAWNLWNRISMWGFGSGETGRSQPRRLDLKEPAFRNCLSLRYRIWERRDVLRTQRYWEESERGLEPVERDRFRKKSFRWEGRTDMGLFYLIESIDLYKQIPHLSINLAESVGCDHFWDFVEKGEIWSDKRTWATTPHLLYTLLRV